MRGSRDELKTDLLSVLEAGRELSPSNDDELVEIFLSRWEASHPEPRPLQGLLSPADPALYGILGILAVLLLIPPVMIAQTYAARDGYLPPLDFGAMPVIYWIALVATVLVLAARLLGHWTGWHVHILLQRRAL
jgi:hypothetical protein